MGQDNGNPFGGLTQMVVPSSAPVTTPPPAPSFDHLGTIQVAPPTGASKIPDSPSIGQKVQQVAEDIIPLSHEARTLQEQVVNPSKSGQQANELVHEQLSHPERMVMGGVEAEGMGELPGAIGSAIEGAASHVRTQPIDADVREGLLNAVQEKVQAKGAVQQADRAGAEDLANRQPYVAPQREPNYVYRSRDIGEQGVPANENSHAQLTSSEDQARLYTQPGQRDAVTGKPQELVRVDLNKLRPSDYSTKKMDEGVNWHKLKRDVPEELVEKMPVDYHAIGKQQGLDFRGVQKGVEGHPGLAIFQDPQSGTSVAVRLDEWSPAKLAEHVAQARQRMAGTSNKPSLLGAKPSIGADEPEANSKILIKGLNSEKYRLLPKGAATSDNLDDSKGFLLGDGSLLSQKDWGRNEHKDITDDLGYRLSKTNPIRIVGPDTFQLYGRPTEPQLQELGRFVKDAGLNNKIFWDLAEPITHPNFLENTVLDARTGSLGEFRRAIDKTYPENEQGKQ